MSNNVLTCPKCGVDNHVSSWSIHNCDNHCALHCPKCKDKVAIDDFNDAGALLFDMEKIREKSIEDSIGSDVSPIKSESFNLACEFVKLLASDLVLPDATPYDNGDMGLDWRRDDIIFTITFDLGCFIYAGIFGQNNEERGKKPFSGEKIPDEIILLLRRYFRK